MRVAVIGAGVIGVTTAYELARDGHEVTVVDRRELPASETSHANAGMVAPGHAYAWSSPKALKTLLRALLRDDLALRFRFQADPRFWRWCWRFLRQCTSERAAYNTAPQGAPVPLQPGAAAPGRRGDAASPTAAARAGRSTSTATPRG